jgi:hypothetical protein
LEGGISISGNREALHQLIDALDDDVLRPALHALVDIFPDHLIRAALGRVRALHARLPIEPPELFNK